MKSGILIAVTLAGLAACTPTVVPTERGIGFDDFSNFELERARREAALTAPRNSIVPPPQVATIAAPSQTQGIASSELALAGIGQAAPVATAA
ncbi:MAG: hypothetical protein NWP79_05040, partial [Paracoccaceae bacterium]|nr:hypothetical protein [Paracoccaceae bacterium]